MAENFHKNYGVPLKMAAVKIAKETKRNGYTQEQYSWADSERRLKIDESEFSKSLDEFGKGTIKNPMVRVMMTPLALKLVGAKLLPIEITTRDLSKILYGKHAGDMDPSIMKQLPRALADPVMIFGSYTGRNGEPRKVVVVSMKDNNGATIVVPLELEANDIPGKYKINRITSAFGKTDKKTGEPSNQWFVKQLEAGRLEYINRKKATDWISSEKPEWPIPKEKINSLFSGSNVTNETDLVKLKNQYPTFYQMAGERANTAMISRLQKAEYMEREAASSKETLIK